MKKKKKTQTVTKLKFSYCKKNPSKTQIMTKLNNEILTKIKKLKL